jgi:hypothetical protein
MFQAPGPEGSGVRIFVVGMLDSAHAAYSGNNADNHGKYRNRQYGAYGNNRSGLHVQSPVSSGFRGYYALFRIIFQQEFQGF